MARRKRRTPRRRTPQPFWLRDELLLLLRAWRDVQGEDGDASPSLPTSAGAVSGDAGAPPALDGNHEKEGSTLLLDAQLETRIYERFCVLVLEKHNGPNSMKRSKSEVQIQLRDLVAALATISPSQKDCTAAAEHEQSCDDVDSELMELFEEIKSRKKPTGVPLVSSRDAVERSGTTPVTAEVSSDAPVTKEELMLFISAWQTVLDGLTAVTEDAMASVDVDILRRFQVCSFTRRAPEVLLQWKQAMRDTHERLSKLQLENDDRDWFALSTKVRSLIQATWELRERDDNAAVVDMDRDMFDELTALFEKERELELKKERAKSTNPMLEHTMEQHVAESETVEDGLRGGNAVVDKGAQVGTSEGGVGSASKRKQPTSEHMEETPARKKGKLNMSSSTSSSSTPTDDASELVVGSTWTRSQLLTLLRAHREMSPREAGESLGNFDDRIFKHVLSLDSSLANRTQRNMVDHKRKILQSREFIADFNNKEHCNGAGSSTESKSWFSLTQKEQMKVVKSKFSRPQFVFLDEELYDQLDAVAGANELLSGAEWSDQKSSLAMILNAWREMLAVAPQRSSETEDSFLGFFLQRYSSLSAGSQMQTDNTIFQKMKQLRATYHTVLQYNKTKQAEAADADSWFSLPTKEKYDEIVSNWSKWKDCVRITRDMFDTLALITTKEQSRNQDATSVQSTASVSEDNAAEMQQNGHLSPTPASPSKDPQIENELNTQPKEKSSLPSHAAVSNGESSQKTPVVPAAPQADDYLKKSDVESISLNTHVLDNAVERTAYGMADKDVANEHVNSTLDDPSSNISEQEPTSFLRVSGNQYPPTHRDSTPEKHTLLEIATSPTKHTETEGISANLNDPLSQTIEQEPTSFLRVSGNQYPATHHDSTPEQRTLLEMISHLDHQATQLGVLIQQLQEEKTAAREERRRERRERKLQRVEQRKLESARRREERLLEKEKDQKLLRELFGKK
ncbi:hypothetical protein FI667_g16461, partial [Globisporangium splendens]